jgi:hypothetical protein
MDSVNAIEKALDSSMTQGSRATSFRRSELDGCLASRQVWNLVQSNLLKTERDGRLTKEDRHGASNSIGK